MELAVYATLARSAQSWEQLGLVPLLGWQRDGDTVSLYLQRADSDVRALLKEKGQFPTPMLLHVMHDCLRALTVLHRLHVAHLDASLDNIFVFVSKSESKRRERYCLGDLATARRFEEGQLFQGATGKDLFMPPEVVSGQYFDPAKADLFTMGVNLWLLAFGSHPFQIGSKIENSVGGWKPFVNQMESARGPTVAALLAVLLAPMAQRTTAAEALRLCETAERTAAS
jgi:serine/threonine protein kinase